MTHPDSSQSRVFINCPFDPDYKEMMWAIVFAILDCGFIPRCAAEVDDGAEIRIEKICRIIGDCKYAVHDLSRTESEENGLPRFNMPLELGIFLGAKKFGGKQHQRKSCLILDTEQYRYQQFISDIAGQDIRAHNNQPETAVARTRDFLGSASRGTVIPGGAAMWAKYQDFRSALPEISERLQLAEVEMTFGDLTNVAGTWLQERAPLA